MTCDLRRCYVRWRVLNVHSKGLHVNWRKFCKDRKQGINNDVGLIIVPSLCLGQGDKIIVWTSHSKEGDKHTTRGWVNTQELSNPNWLLGGWAYLPRNNNV